MYRLERGDVVVRPAKFSDVLYLQDRLRQSDREEIWASDGVSPVEALTDGLSSPFCQTVLFRGFPTAMFGTAPTAYAPGVGCVWFLASDDLQLMRLQFLRMSGERIARMLEDYKTLFNWVDARNKVSIQWLRWCGATLHDPVAYGKYGLPFHYFTIQRRINYVLRSSRNDGSSGGRRSYGGERRKASRVSE